MMTRPQQVERPGAPALKVRHDPGHPPEGIDYAQVLDDIDDGVYCVDQQRRITYWNRAAERISGFTAEEVRGHRCADNLLVHVDAKGQPLCLVGCPLSRTLEDGSSHQAEVYLHHKDGHRLPVSVRVSPLRDAGGEVVGAVETFSDNSAKRVLAERVGNLERLAMLDQLTELPNRRYLEMNLALRVSELQRYGWPFGVLLIDIDHFKEVNDTYGHEVGDKALKMVARTLTYSSRVFDVVGRWGGEEFLAIVSHIEPAQLWNVAERLRVMIGQSILEVREGLVQVTASIGATMAEPSEELDRVLRRVDRRLYQAKHTGRDRVVAAEPGEEAPRHEERPYEIIESGADSRSGAGRKA